MATIQAKSIRRREDQRLLTGQGNYAADTDPAGMAVAVSFSVGLAMWAPAWGLAAKAGVVRVSAMARVMAARIGFMAWASRIGIGGRTSRIS